MQWDMDFDELEEDPYHHIVEYYSGAFEACEHVKVKFWLLDAAMQQFSSGKLFSRKKRQYLPDEVFCRPGMTEKEMVAYMKLRGANKTCIQYARRKFNEERSKGACHSDGSGSDWDGKSQVYTEDATAGSSHVFSTVARSSYVRKSWSRLKKAFAGSDVDVNEPEEHAQ